jgi:hypothetical protein
VRWHVYVDLARALTPEEQRTIFAAVDEIIPGSGCVGPQRGGKWELYFVVEASSTADATASATDYARAVLDRAGFTIAFALELVPIRRRPWPCVRRAPRRRSGAREPAGRFGRETAGRFGRETAGL